MTGGQPACRSWCWAPRVAHDQIFHYMYDLYCSTFTWWKGGSVIVMCLNFVWVWKYVQYILAHIHEVCLTFFVYGLPYVQDMYMASISPGSVQKIMPLCCYSDRYLNGHVLDLLYFLCWALPFPTLRTFSSSWFCMTSACCLPIFVIK